MRRPSSWRQLAADAELLLDLLQLLDRSHARTLIEPEQHSQLAAKTKGFVALHARHGGFHFRRQPGFRSQQQLMVEYRARRSGRITGCGRVHANAAVRPDRQGKFREQPLQENESRLLAYEAPGLMPLGDQSVDIQSGCRQPACWR